MNVACDLVRIRRDIEAAVATISGDARVDVRVQRTESGVRDTVIATEYVAGEGVPAVSAASVWAQRATTAGHKALAYGAHGDALAEASSRGCSDALLVDEDGLVREAATANVFAVSARTLVTAKDRVLAGITRAAVLDLARLTNLAVAYRALSLEELLASDALLLTSSVRGIALVNAIDGMAVGTLGGTRTTHTLAALLRERLRKP
jgi:branched-subunit amino acid aminotransferase/4-amino-4-deoxychorismate lyase